MHPCEYASVGLVSQALELLHTHSPQIPIAFTHSRRFVPTKAQAHSCSRTAERFRLHLADAQLHAESRLVLHLPGA
jgi:hypothetical protein